ncbi:secreted RxLR effector protein 161-like [Apium graveolens]|uniref:secreted RxLR effector protein 161-like n=1 Tax=Apium graveolens TaxID=4045 RepID=UPI003D78F5F0
MGTSEDITNAANYLKNEFEMKDLGKTKFCLGLQKKNPFHPRKEDEDPLGPEVPFLSAIGALTYLANNTRPDIAFAVNLLARFSSDPTKRHWDEITHILRYLRGTIDLGLFFPNNLKSQLVGYANVGYLSDPHVGRSQTGYLFTYCETAISWKSTK